MHILASVLILIGCLGASISLVLWPEEGRRDRLLIGALGLSVRLLFAVAANTFLAFANHGRLFPDEKGYLTEAYAVQAGQSFTNHAYANFLGLIFKATGKTVWLPVAINIIAGTLIALATYEIFRRLANRRAALAAALAVALWPSLVVWSGFVLKDSLTLLGLLGAMLGALQAFRGERKGLILGLFSFIAVALLRRYAYAVASVASLASLLVTAAVRRIHLTMSLAFVIVAGLVGLFLGQGFLGAAFITSHARPETVAFARTEGSEGNSGFTEKTSANDELAKGIPRGLFYTMLGPFPWEAGDPAGKALLAVELPLWYSALGFAGLGFLRLRKEFNWVRWLLPLSFAVGTIVVLAIYEGNAGTALRQRAMIIPVVLGLAATVVGPQLVSRWPDMLGKDDRDQEWPSEVQPAE